MTGIYRTERNKVGKRKIGVMPILYNTRNPHRYRIVNDDTPQHLVQRPRTKILTGPAFCQHNGEGIRGDHSRQHVIVEEGEPGWLRNGNSWVAAPLGSAIKFSAGSILF